MLSKLSIATKSLIVLIIVILVSVCSVIIGLSSSYRLEQSAISLEQVNDKISQNITLLFIHEKYIGDLSRSLIQKKEFESKSTYTDCALGIWYYQFKLSNDFKSLPQDIQDKFLELEKAHETIHNIGHNYIDNYQNGDENTKKQIEQDILYTAPKILTVVISTLKDYNTYLEHQKDVILENNHNMVNSIYVFFGIIMFFGTLSFIFGLIVNKSIKQYLISTVSNILESTKEVAVSADAITRSSQNLSELSMHQSKSVEDIARSIQITSDVIIKNNGLTFKSTKLSTEANTLVKDGDKDIKNLLKSMENISTSSKQISNVIKIIDTISFQTNLLALNASVEAARAGEYGLGFAVVAQEVKELANRATTATKDTEQIIQKSLQYISSGDDIANQTSNTFTQIDSKIAEITNLMNQISTLSKEQSNAIQTISKEIKSVEDITLNLSSNAEELTVSAELLSAKANEINDEVTAMVNNKS